MTRSRTTTCTAFAGTKQIASGDLPQVALQAKAVLDRDKWAQVLIFDDITSNLIEVDFRGTPEDLLRQFAERAPEIMPPSETGTPDGDPRRPGRPRLGVVAREVTLLPRHWEWLASQPGGASVALRKLVEQARLANRGIDHRRRAQESAYRFLSAMAGNEPGFEEAIRALFGGKQECFGEMTESWPDDVRDHARKLAAAAFAEPHPRGPSARGQV
ncbi:MAG: DUF2239 family protein [Candidatus Solibacter sp.]|nr:DUF2239 family protein [Candidatus Solibacter sp.]